MKSRISVNDAAKIYKVTPRAIHYWIAQDKIRAYDNRYEIDDLQRAWEKRHRPKPRISI